VRDAVLSHTIGDATIAERVVRVRLSSRLALVLHAPALDAPLTFADLDRVDDARALPHWLDPVHDPAAFYASWRPRRRTVWGGMVETDVHVFARGAVTPAWWALHYCGGDAATFRADPYPGALAFRAFAWGAKARVVALADACETPESFGWLMCHELAHVAYAQTPFLRRAFAAERAARGLEGADARYDDAAHEADPEERAADAAATALMGACYDRRWWRARLGQVRMTLSHRVPAGVPAVTTVHASPASR
jgi:hypothetical protein